MVIRVICVYRFQIDNGPQETPRWSPHNGEGTRRYTHHCVEFGSAAVSNWNRYGLNQTRDARWSHAPTAGG
jgi:hypothetical protein